MGLCNQATGQMKEPQHEKFHLHHSEHLPDVWSQPRCRDQFQAGSAPTLTVQHILGMQCPRCWSDRRALSPRDLVGLSGERVAPGILSREKSRQRPDRKGEPRPMMPRRVWLQPGVKGGGQESVQVMRGGFRSHRKRDQKHSPVEYTL